MDVLGVEPPLLPVLGIVGSDTGVSNRGIKLIRLELAILCEMVDPSDLPKHLSVFA